jgi:hypothetical protein
MVMDQEVNRERLSGHDGHGTSEMWWEEIKRVASKPQVVKIDVSFTLQRRWAPGGVLLVAAASFGDGLRPLQRENQYQLSR